MIKKVIKTFKSISEKLALFFLRAARREGALDHALYNQLAYYMTSIGVEGVALRLSASGVWEVYLTQRELNDRAYPGQWHCPGSLLRRGEVIKDVMLRLGVREFNNPITDFEFIDEFYHQEARGWFQTKIYVVTLGNPDFRGPGKWFPVNQLPAGTVKHHSERIIPLALKGLKQKDIKQKIGA